MIFDTGSNWLWVNGRFCENCAWGKPKFDERNSSTFHFYDVIMDLHYGSGDAYGYNSHDSVCLKPGSCASDFSFVTIGMQQGLDALASSGIVGLSPMSTGTMGDLFILKMKKSGVIDKALFSIMIELVHDKSKMTFGGVDMANLAALGSTMTYHDVASKHIKWWTLSL